MTYLINQQMKEMIEALYLLQEGIRPRLTFASPEARREWRKVRRQIPKSDEVGRGEVLVSEQELITLREKTGRFSEILRCLGRESSRMTQAMEHNKRCREKAS